MVDTMIDRYEPYEAFGCGLHIEGDYVLYNDILTWAQEQFADCTDQLEKFDRGSIIHKSYMDMRFAFGQLLSYLEDDDE